MPKRTRDMFAQRTSSSTTPSGLSVFASVYQQIETAYLKQVDGTGVAMFRIAFSLVLLLEVVHVFYFRALVFDVIPFIQPNELDVTLPLLIWMGVIMALILGLFTRPAAVVNYAFVLMFFSSARSSTYMMTPVYVGMSFLFIFLPLSRCLSLDRLRLALKYTTVQREFSPSRTVSQLAYYVPVAVGLAFVYLDSTLYKLASPMWLKGLGMWKVMSTPFEVQLDISPVLNVEWLVKGLSYLTLIFEFLFLFLFPFRKYRLVLLLIGAGLHLSILLAFPFPLFALGIGSLYLLMVPASLWRRLMPRPATSQALTFYQPAQSLGAAKLRQIIRHFDLSRAINFRVLATGNRNAVEPTDEAYCIDQQGREHRGFAAFLQVLRAIWYLRPLYWLLRLPGSYHLAQAVYNWLAANGFSEWMSGNLKAPDYQTRNEAGHKARMRLVVLGLTGLLLLQGAASYNALLPQLLRRKLEIETTLPGRILNRVAQAAAGMSGMFLGIVTHPIALDEHFAGYTRVVAVTYTGADGAEHFLPITRTTGQPGYYTYGVLWVKWTYQVVSRQLDEQRLENGIQSFTAFWAIKNHIDLNHCQFRIKVKKIREAGEWEPDFLTQQLAADWQDVGYVTWENHQFFSHISHHSLL